MNHRSSSDPPSALHQAIQAARGSFQRRKRVIEWGTLPPGAADRLAGGQFYYRVVHGHKISRSRLAFAMGTLSNDGPLDCACKGF